MPDLLTRTHTPILGATQRTNNFLYISKYSTLLSCSFSCKHQQGTKTKYLGHLLVYWGHEPLFYFLPADKYSLFESKARWGLMNWHLNRYLAFVGDILHLQISSNAELARDWRHEKWDCQLAAAAICQEIDMQKLHAKLTNKINKYKEIRWNKIHMLLSGKHTTQVDTSPFAPMRCPSRKQPFIIDHKLAKKDANTSAELAPD